MTKVGKNGKIFGKNVKNVGKCFSGWQNGHSRCIIGICQWQVTSGRMDINYTASSLSHFAAAPREGHLALAQKILGSLKKYPNKGYAVNPKNPLISLQYEEVDLKEDFGNQYCYFKEEIDPQFPEALMKELPISISCDADHGHNKTTGQSITGIIFVLWDPHQSFGAQNNKQVCKHQQMEPNSLP